METRAMSYAEITKTGLRQVYSEGDMSDDTCRICYGGDSTEELIRPCKCSGSLAFVHSNCLNSWVENSGSPRCEICSTNYPLSINFRWWNIWNDIWVKYVIRQEPFFIFVSALINILSSFMFRPLFVISQLWEDFIVFLLLLFFLVLIAVTFALFRNLIRFIVWQWDAYYTMFKRTRERERALMARPPARYAEEENAFLDRTLFVN